MMQRFVMVICFDVGSSKQALYCRGSYPAGAGSEESHSGSSDGGRCSKSALVPALIP